MRLSTSTADQWLKLLVSKALPIRTRKILRFYKASCYHWIGLDYFPAHNGLDRKLLKYIGGIREGVFIEAGANDGLSQSNTWHLERHLGWRGLLIEPVPEIAELCKRFRKSLVENCALGSFEQDGSRIVLHYGGLMTAADTADIAHMDGGSAKAHANRGAAWVGDATYSFTSPVYALSNLLDRHHIDHVDFMSLDVEGFERHVLQGIDFTRHRIKFILIETSNLEEVRKILGERYKLIDKFSKHDYLFIAR